MPAPRCEARVRNRRDRQLDPRLLGETSVLRGVEGALDAVDAGGQPDAPGQRRGLPIGIEGGQPFELGQR